MSDIVFILGAGASFDCGAPLMANFLDVAKDLYASNHVGDRGEQFKKIFSVVQSLQMVHSKAYLDLDNIESIFTTIELGRIINRIPGPDGVLKAEETDQVIAALRELIVVTLEQRMRYPFDNQFVSPPTSYKRFARLVNNLTKMRPSKSVSIISFNYDVGVDLALQVEDFPIDYCLDDGGKEGAIKLLKLHGSLNWGRVVSDDGQGERIVPIDVRQYTLERSVGIEMRDSTTRVQIGTNLKAELIRRGHTPAVAEPVIVPPSWNKADYHRQLSSVWGAAARELSEATRIYIIGYSLPDTDSFFRQLYALGTAGGPNLREFSVFNPEKKDGSVDVRFAKMLGGGALARYHYQEKTFSDAIDHIADDFRVADKVTQDRSMRLSAPVPPIVRWP